ncbi:MAG TPA: HDIG domain-containing protein [Methanoregulaceae archaeon]|nr:HDIG domain-containing protein [Methanoregulaceae archaeon]
MREDDSRIETLLKEAGCSVRVIAHCHAVRDLALASADGAGVLDRELLNAGALLHDIGRGVTHSLHHAQAGAAYLRDAGISPGIVRIVERHIGAGLTSDECTLLGILPIDCMPRTGEEKVVANADNLVRGSRVVSIYDRLESSRYLGRKIMFRTYRLWLFCEQIRRTPAPKK